MRQAASQKACADERLANPTLGNPYDCFTNIKFDDLIPLGPSILRYSMLAICPTVGVFVFGLAIGWVIAGFRKEA
jgi:hypothetical protein